MQAKRLLVGAMALLAVLGGAVSAQNRKDEDSNTRMVQGVVSDASGGPAAKAVVQLKDGKTLQVRSFVTQQDGAYHFAGLSTNVDYELKAERDGASSGTKNVSVFDSRKQVEVNLKLK